MSLRTHHLFRSYWQRWDRHRYHWRVLWAILQTMNRMAELKRLARWAHQKRLSGPLHHYEFLLADAEQRHLRYSLRHPRLVRWVRFLHVVAYLIFPPPRYYYKGSASGYQTRKRR